MGFKNEKRLHKVGEAIQKELAELIQKELNDPRLGMVTLSEVRLNRDLSVARVFFTVYESEKKAQSLKVLKHCKGFLRRHLAQKISLRTVPDLEFMYDTTLEKAERIQNLLKEAGDPKHNLDDMGG